MSGKQTFKVEAHLLVPAALSIEALRREVGTLASEMMVDIALGERQAESQTPGRTAPAGVPAPT
ncbi:hypothetical protein D3C86_2223500 [compost metagenome]